MVIDLNTVVAPQICLEQSIEKQVLGETTVSDSSSLTPDAP
jgi:hypothetical protein